jgi:hypothetical protein
MRGRSRLLRVTGALLCAVVAAISATAVAYFTTTGLGTASASVADLPVPSISAATPTAGGTVTLTWGAVTPPGSGTVNYYVTRDGGTPAGNCPTAAAPASVTTCTDSGLAVGTHTYTVTATWHSWTEASATKSANVTVGPAANFAISAASTTPVAGVADNLTITAKDANNSTVTTYTGAHNLTFSGASSSPAGNAPTIVNSAGTAVAFGTATALNFTNGVASVASSKNGVMKIFAAGAATVSATDGSISTSPNLSVTVSPTTASKLVLSAASTTPTAGAADNLTTTAQDTYGNTATSYTGARSLTFSGASAAPAGNVPTVTDSAGAAVAFGTATAINFTAGVASASGGANGEARLYKSGSTSLKVSDGTLTSANSTVTVAPATAAKFLLSAASTTPVAGAADNLTTTAQDTYGNTATAYTGARNITFSGANASPSGSAPTVVNSAGTAVAFGTATALTFTSGVAAVASSKNGVMKLNRAETASVTATDGSISTPSGLAVIVSPGTAARLAWSGVAVSAGAIGSPCLFTCAVTAIGNSGTITARVNVTDSLGNTVSNIGTGHTVSVTANGGAVSGGSLTLNGTGVAESTTQFTYTAPASGSFSNTITAATSGGTVYTSATATAGK